MWKPSEHTDDDNVRWAWLRAVEWIYWPLFIGQAVVPILLCIYDWRMVIGAVVLVAFVWRIFLVPFWISPRLADFGPFVVWTRYLTGPVSGVVLWQNGNIPIAALAALWPLFGSMAVQFVLTLPMALVSLTRFGKGSQVGPVQSRLLLALGFASSGVHS